MSEGVVAFYQGFRNDELMVEKHCNPAGLRTPRYKFGISLSREFGSP